MSTRRESQVDAVTCVGAYLPSVSHRHTRAHERWGEVGSPTALRDPSKGNGM